MIGEALAGLRVVEITTSVAGPFSAQILGDLGADVIKVERPDAGDDTRGWGPPFWAGESAQFLALNRNKRSLVLDLKSDRGIDTLRRLLETADVLVQNMRPGALAKLGLGPDELRELNPRLISCDLTGFGGVGPDGDQPAYDPLVQAYGGLMSLNGATGGPPARVPASILDQGTALWTVIAVLAALRIREQTGRGGHVETSLLGSALMWLPAQFVGLFADGTVPERLGSGTVGVYPYAAFPTNDEELVVAAGNESLWQRLCRVLERPDLAADERFATNPDRVTHRRELEEELSRTFRTRGSAAWAEELARAGIPASPVQTLDQVAADEQVAALGGFVDVEHPRIEDFRLVNMPVRYDGAYPPVRRVPPLLGEHTEEIVREIEVER